MVNCVWPDQQSVALTKRILKERKENLELTINAANTYFFPRTQYSNDFLDGWGCVKQCIEDIGEEKFQKPGDLYATNNRHHVSTMFTYMSITDEKVRYLRQIRAL